MKMLAFSESWVTQELAEDSLMMSVLLGLSQKEKMASRHCKLMLKFKQCIRFVTAR